MRLRLRGVAPGSPPVVLIDVGADGSLVLPPGLEADFAPFPLFTFPPGLPQGTYTLICRLEDASSGALFWQHQVAFEHP